jgi:hypothetical protein
MNVYFAHGKESGPWGTKIKALVVIAESKGFNVINPDYSSEPDPDVRVKQLLNLIFIPSDITVLVGSSMGGYVSTVASQVINPTGLFLMAPAFYLPEYKEQLPTPNAKKTVIVHGLKDEVVPVENSIRFAREHHTELHILEGDHQLTDQLPKIEVLFSWFLDEILDAQSLIKCLSWKDIENKIYFRDGWVMQVWEKIVEKQLASYNYWDDFRQVVLRLVYITDFYQAFQSEFSQCNFKEVNIAEAFELSFEPHERQLETTQSYIIPIILETFGGIGGIVQSIYDYSSPTIYDEDDNEYVLDPDDESCIDSSLSLDPEEEELLTYAEMRHAEAIKMITIWLEGYLRSQSYNEA